MVVALLSRMAGKGHGQFAEMTAPEGCRSALTNVRVVLKHCWLEKCCVAGDKERSERVSRRREATRGGGMRTNLSLPGRAATRVRSYVLRGQDKHPSRVVDDCRDNFVAVKPQIGQHQSRVATLGAAAQRSSATDSFPPTTVS